MTHKTKLNDIDRETVVVLFNKGNHIKDIANYFGVHSRTIGRALDESGVARPMKRGQEETKLVLELLKKYQVELKDLETVLKYPKLSMENVQLFLNGCTQEQLAKLFYKAGIVKIAEMHNAQLQTNMLNIQEKAKKEAQQANLNLVQPNTTQ